MTVASNKESKEPVAPATREFDPGHVMTRQHYERLAREAAAQK
jgi:hypothetical protein